MPTIALVTGSNRGLGLEVARQLARAGATVVIGARDPDKGRQAAGVLNGEGLDAESVQLDVTDGASAQRAAAWLRDRYGALDVLVNNAGILPEASAQGSEVIDASLFRQTFDTNLLGVAATTEKLLPSCASHALDESSTSRARWGRSPTRATQPRPTTRSSSRHTRRRRPR